MTYTPYDIISHYLDNIAKLNSVDVDTLFYDNIKLSITKTIQNTNYEIELYRRVFDVEMKEPNVLKLLYFSASTLKKYLKAIYELDLKKLMLLLMKSYIKDSYKMDNTVSNDFFNRTCKKIEEVLLFNKELQYYGEYGLYTIFISLVRVQTTFELPSDTDEEKRSIKQEIKKHKNVKSYILYSHANDIIKNIQNNNSLIIKGYKVGSTNSIKRIYRVENNKLIGVYKGEILEENKASVISKKYSTEFNDNIINNYIDKYAYNDLYVYKLTPIKVLKEPKDVTITQISSNYIELSDEDIKNLEALAYE